ncbi:thioredoxin-dependent thiol peroxidase [Candidatus Woesearchaeota archaeon]|nr:thioredoxin-dependent thiol peroxidase [Candidatus Woesearchaeota archaeon]
MAINIGSKAPDFSLNDIDGNNVKLTDFGGKNVVLYFYPKDNTPGCAAEACSFRDKFLKYKKKGIVVLGVSKDNEISHKNFIDKYKLPFTLLCDINGEVCKKYDCWGKKKLYGKEYEGILRKTFLIDKNGIIKYIFDKVNCETHGEDVLEIF